MRRLTGARTDDSGQGLLPLMILVSLSIIAIMMMLIVPWGAATTERAQSQTAADAAALAGLQTQREAWSQATRPGVLTFLTVGAARLAAREAGVGPGQASAALYAQRNGSVLRNYVSSPDRGRVFAQVEEDRTSDPDTGLARTEATAEMDLDLAGCAWDNPLPEPLLAGNGGPPYFERTLRCGGWFAKYRIDNATATYAILATTAPPTTRCTTTSNRASSADDGRLR